MEERVLSVLRTVFKDDTIDANCSQKNCAAWDSMNHLNFVVELEDWVTGLNIKNGDDKTILMCSWEKK